MSKILEQNMLEDVSKEGMWGRWWHLNQEQWEDSWENVTQRANSKCKSPQVRKGWSLPTFTRRETDQCVWKQREDQCVWRAKSRWREERVRDLGWPSAAGGNAGVVLKHQREPLEGSNMRIDFVYVLHPSLWLVWGMDCLRGNRETSEEVLAIVQEETAMT